MKNMNNTEIKPLKEPIKIKLEQYECDDCKKKFYINTEDKTKGVIFMCPFCMGNGKTKNIRIFDVIINGIGDYKNE